MKKGSAWRIMIPDGRVADSGEILEIEPYRKLVLTWRNEFRPELREEGHSRLTYELEQQGDMVKLTLLHEMDKPGSKLIAAVTQGWPAILSSLKSMLETGEPAGSDPPLADGQMTKRGPLHRCVSPPAAVPPPASFEDRAAALANLSTRLLSRT